MGAWVSPPSPFTLTTGYRGTYRLVCGWANIQLTD